MNDFTFTIELGNDAMQTPDDVADALRDVAARLSGGSAWYDTSGSIRDINGNTIGRWEVV